MKSTQLFWDKLRVLVTNRCNYKCPFCHNEGQSKGVNNSIMRYSDFSRLIDILSGQMISELHFSGGEPFLNPEVVEMIELVDDRTSWGIGCATNLSKVSSEQIARLAKTRVKLNIQFPYANSFSFHKSTGNGDYGGIISKILEATSAGVAIGLNAVIQNENTDIIAELIEFALEYQLPLKLLPQIGLKGSDKFKDRIYPLLERSAIDIHNKETGAIRWTLQRNGKKTVVLYIDSPCFTHNIDVCRKFGELRILPDLTLQPCIQKNSTFTINLSDGKDKVIEQMTSLWNNFKTC